MAFSENVADVGNGRIEYLDTGAPSFSSYETFVLIPGSGHNCYVNLLNNVPSNVRAISISQRGLGRSSDLSSEQLAGTVEPRQIFDTHVTDLQKFLQFTRDNLAISKTNLLAWSMGSTTVVGCFTPEHLSTTQSLLPFMKRIILWDAPSIGFGIPPTPTAKALFSREHFIEYVASFCIYPEEYLMSRVPGVATQIFPFQGSTLDDPQYPVWAKKAVDLHSIAGNNRSNISNDPTTVQQKYREAHHNLAKAAVEKQVLYGTRAIPENLEGAWVSRDWIVEGGGSCKVIVMEGLNHFAHFHEPVKMWNALRE